MVRIIAFIAILLMAPPVLATTWYVEKDGSDANTGKSWAQSCQTITFVNDSTAGGDTVFFGTGTWRDFTIVPPAGGTYSDRTVYACSAFTRGIAKFYGGQNLSASTWGVYSGYIYATEDLNPTGGYYDSVLNQNPPTTLYCLVEDDSLLKPQTEIGNLDAAGEFFYSYNKDSLYLWCTDSLSPTTHDIETSVRCPILVANKPYPPLQGRGEYTTFWGFDIRYCEENCVFLWGADLLAPKPDSFFLDHCNVSYAAGDAGSNNSLFGTAMKFDTSEFGHYNRVRSCSLRYVWDISGNLWHYKGVSMYGEHNLAVESCYIAGVGVGIDFKNDNHSGIDTLWHRGCVARFNTIMNPANVGIHVMRGMYQDSIYGNIIVGSGDMTINLLGHNSLGGAFIQNNTLYDITYQAFVTGNYNDDQTPPYSGQPAPNYVKYNIFHTISYGGTPIMARYFYGDYNSFTCDSNYYYDDTAIKFRDSSATVYDFGDWQSTHGLEVNSDTTDPGLNDPANGDFSRLGASNEMNRTYGGRTWTIFGAWQPSVSTPQRGKFKAETIKLVEADSEGFMLSKWDAWFRIGYGNVADSNRFFRVSDNSFEWEAVFNERPISHVWKFPIESENFNFYYQSIEYSPWEIARDAYRPDSARGSYAVYHKTLQDNGFTTGKAFQFYRPWLKDATGDKIWTILNIENDTMRVSADSVWLANAIYPVIFGPTFGHTDVGVSDGQWSQDEAYGHVLPAQQYTASTSDTITKYSYHGKSSSGIASVAMSAYTFVSGEPNTRLATPAVINLSTGDADWYHSSAVEQELTNGTVYVVCVGDKVHDGNFPRFTYDSVADAISVQADSALAATWTENITWLYKISMYATYSQVGAPSYIRVLK